MDSWSFQGSAKVLKTRTIPRLPVGKVFELSQLRCDGKECTIANKAMLRKPYIKLHVKRIEVDAKLFQKLEGAFRKLALDADPLDAS